MMKDSPQGSSSAQSRSLADEPEAAVRNAGPVRRSTTARCKLKPPKVSGAAKLQNSNDDTPQSSTKVVPANKPSIPVVKRKTPAESRQAASLAAHYLKMRRRRSAIIGADIFADPCWDMLLDLFVQASNGIDVSVKSACLASGVPCTTALGYVSILEREGLIIRSADRSDRRRTFLRLSDAATIGIRSWVTATFKNSST